MSGNDDSQGSFFSADTPQASLPAYVLVSQRDAAGFSAAVSQLIAEKNYRPSGGVFVAMSNNAPVFCQALVLAGLK